MSNKFKDGEIVYIVGSHSPLKRIVIEDKTTSRVKLKADNKANIEYKDENEVYSTEEAAWDALLLHADYVLKTAENQVTQAKERYEELKKKRLESEVVAVCSYYGHFTLWQWNLGTFIQCVAVLPLKTLNELLPEKDILKNYPLNNLNGYSVTFNTIEEYNRAKEALVERFRKQLHAQI